MFNICFPWEIAKILGVVGCDEGVIYLMLLMGNHSICFHGDIRNFGWKKHLIKSYDFSSLPYLSYNWTNLFYPLMMYPKAAEWVANNVDTDQMLHSATSNLGLHCFLSLCFTPKYLYICIFNIRRSFVVYWATSFTSTPGSRNLGQKLCSFIYKYIKFCLGLGGSVYIGLVLSGDCGLDPHGSRQHSLVVIDHEMVSTIILSLPLIQEGQLSVAGERMCCG